MLGKDSLRPSHKPNHSFSVRIIRHGKVCDKLDVSDSKLFDMVANGQFPKPFTLIPGGRAVGWLEHEVDDWILTRKAEHLGGLK